jgi:hypothetical protein
LLKVTTDILAAMKKSHSLSIYVLAISRKAEQLVNLYPHGDVTMRDNGN